MSTLHVWQDQMQLLLNRLSGFGQPGVCTFKQGDINGCEAIDFDDGSWKKVMGKGAPIPGISTDSIAVEGEETKLDLCDWSMADGPAAMRKVLSLPDTVEGLPVKGTKIFITLTMLAPLEIYIDGKLAASYRFWGDTRKCELTVTESYQTGEEHVVVFKTPKGEENDGDAHLGVYFNLGVIEDAMLDLSTALEQTVFAQKLYSILKKPELKKALDALENVLDAEAIADRDWDAIRKMVSDIDAVLKPFEPYAKEYKVHLIAHAHIDMNWLWNMDDTKDICVRDFKSVADIMDDNPDVYFSQSQTAVYDIVKKENPELFERVKEKIREGKWDITAATWTESDLNMSSGESLARQILLSSEFIKDELGGKASQICWEPDTFGHPATMPNVLAKAGVKYYYQFRCGAGYPIYWWEGTDGSRVLAFCFGPYNNALRPTNVMPVVHELLDDYGMKTSMFVFGVGDHGGGPARNDIRIKRYLDQKPVMPTMIFSSTHDFYDKALEEKSDYPVVIGERNFIFEGCYTTKTETKKLMRYGESRAYDAEALMAYLGIIDKALDRTDNEDLKQAWKHICFNQFHDIVCGCNITAADEYDEAIGREAIKTAERLIEAYMAKLAGVDTGKGLPLVVFNQLAYERSDVVEKVLPGGMETGTVVDELGNVVPAQFENAKVIFIANGIPAFGYKIYYLQKGAYEGDTINAKVRSGYVDGTVTTVETDTYLLELSSRTGTIIKLYDKKAGRDVLDRLQGEPEVSYAFRGENSSNMLKMLYEEPHIMSAWVIGNIKEVKNLISTPEITLVSAGAVKATLKVSRKFNETLIDQLITVYNGFSRVDFQTDVDWHEKGYYQDGVPFLKVGFSAAMSNPKYAYETPMGWIDRQIDGAELPSIRFVNAHEGDYGISLYNDSKYGFSVDGNRMYMSIVRGSYSPDAMPDEGLTSVKYAIQPHDGQKDMPNVVKGAAAFNQPLLTVWGDQSAGAVSLPDKRSFIEVSADNVVVSSIKPALDCSGIIVRVVETAGENTKFRLALNGEYSSISETDMMEDSKCLLANNTGSVDIEIKKFENKTIKFEY